MPHSDRPVRLAAHPGSLLPLFLLAKPSHIQLPGAEPIPILYEDRAVLAIDKPAGWMLVPVSWQKTTRNLQAALLSSIAGGAFWARSRSIKFLRNIHRLDGPTSGVLLYAKSIGALNSIADLFESRKVEKVYLAVTNRAPKEDAWTCRLSLSPDPDEHGRNRIDRNGKPAETEFKVLAAAGGRWLIEARPYTGRTHQIRLHLAAAECPVEGDELYGQASRSGLGLRAAGLAYHDPFTRRPIRIGADSSHFLQGFGFGGLPFRPEFRTIIVAPRTPSRGAASDSGRD